MKRRDFLKVLGVTGAGAATVGCSSGAAGKGAEKLLPYVIPSEDIVPGMPTYYASTCRECPAGCGIQVETHEGRVTKVEGTPDHPVSHGNLCLRGQASVQGLYHPDRFRGPTVAEETGLPARDVSWQYAEQSLAGRIRAAGAGRTVLLTSGYGPTMSRLADAFAGAIGARRVDYSPMDQAPRGLNFADTDVLVAFGADFLETWGSPVDYAWQFKQMHAYRAGHRGKFVWVGPHRPLTGINADQWIAPKPGTEALIALAMSGGVSAAEAAQQTGVDQKTIETLSAEFRAGKGYALGPGAAIAGKNASALQAAVDRLNGGASAAPVADARPLQQLVQQMKAGQVQVLIIDGMNPAYSLPGSLGFAEALAKVPTRVSLSPFPDETSALCNFILPGSHFLESWDDYVPRPGVFDLVQQAMRPVFNTKQSGDVLLSLAQQLNLPTVGGGAPSYYEYLRAGWAGIAGGTAWRDAVRRGGVYPTTGGGTGAFGFLPLAARTATAAPAAAPAPATVGMPAPAPATGPGGNATYQAAAFEGDANGYHLVVYPSHRFYDGRNANRPWLLELPDPVTKVSWDSWVEIHPATAKKLGIRQGDALEVKSPYGTLTARAYPYPGVRQDTVAIQMGLGHKEFGRFTKDRGVNPNVLLGNAVDPATGAPAPYGVMVTLRPTGVSNDTHTPGLFMVPTGIYEQGQKVQHDRELGQAIGLADLIALDHTGKGVVPGAEEHIEELKGDGGFTPVKRTTDPASYPGPGTEYGQYIAGETRWAMAIDLQRCTGCSACVVACSAENNIPVVGPTEMRRGREISWLRIERYFSAGQDLEDAESETATDDVRFVPMLCQQCGNAPCEPVCPVYAAYHTPDGLNGQVYNRCVGTRYCANNCPYKVRFFNWLTYEFAEPLNWQLNPDVTVREKGVMEKCTFCVQRIHEAERNAAVAGREPRDGEVVPACVQTCPTEVFVFGNIQDPNSAVAQAAASNRSYRALGELNTQPGIVYLKKVTLNRPANGEAGDEKPAPFGGTEHTPQEAR
jgi:molybdopterin-containing oxidoreductase family iron-sulfur binding subunit